MIGRNGERGSGISVQAAQDDDDDDDDGLCNLDITTSIREGKLLTPLKIDLVSHAVHGDGLGKYICFGLIVLHGISTLVGYSMSNPAYIYIYIVKMS